MIRTDRLSFSIGDFKLRQLTIEMEKGQHFVLLGPPGSGKTIFLECLCGLKRIGSGRIFINGRDVTLLEPRMRGIGYVPQDYALFPHRTVRGNIAFGLRACNIPRSQISKRVDLTAEMLGIKHLLARPIAGLSGGEKQRTALARALVMEPKVLLLDEPVSALDEGTRQEVCALLHRIQRQLGLTTIHVSHNLEEAFSVADRAAILHQGILQQVSTLDELLRKPKNEFVAHFMRCGNIFRAEVIGAGADLSSSRVKTGDIQLNIPGKHQGSIKWMIRPEDVLVYPHGGQGDKMENALRVNLARWRDYGGYVKVELDGPINLVAHLTGAGFAELKAGPGCDLTAVLHARNIHVLPE